MNASVIKFDLLSEDVCNALTQEMLLHNKAMAWDTSSTRTPGTPHKYKPSNMFNDIHQSSVDKIEETVGCKLFPTFNFMRIYQNGSILAKHLDRPACEYGCGITLGIGSDDPTYRWALNYSVDDKSMSETFDIGEAGILCGTKIPHWREPFEGKWQLQGMMFFVNADGEYSHLRNDRYSSDYPSLPDMVL